MAKRQIDWDAVKAHDVRHPEHAVLTHVLKDGTVCVLRDQHGKPAFVDGKPAFNGPRGRKGVDNALYTARQARLERIRVKALGVVQDAKPKARSFVACPHWAEAKAAKAKAEAKATLEQEGQMTFLDFA